MNNGIRHTGCPVCGSSHIHRLLDIKDHSISKENFQMWQCADCTLRFTQDIPAPGDIGRYYQSDDYISHSDTKKGLISGLYHFAKNITLRSKRNLLNNVTGKQGGALLDLGCGTGAFLHTMKEAGWNVKGVEPDEGARKKAKELYALDILPATEFFSLHSKQFDVITMWHVLEHVHELHAYIDNLRELLKDDGVLIIAVPNYTSWDARYYHYFWAAYDVPRHLYHFSPESMSTLMNKHGFNVIQKKPMWLDALYVSMLSERYRGSALPVVQGAIKGIWFNIRTLFDKSSCSSLIYIIRKSPN